jgi:LPS export ABC transporter permease LptG/LPS export ABC transporter permease LptF
VRILTRYILWEVVSHALLGGLLFTFVLFMRDLGQILDLVVRDNAPLSSVVQVFIYTLPNTLTVTLPMATLVGVLLGLSRMAADSEIIAMRTAGIGVGYFVRVLAMVGVAACAVALLNTLWIAPRATEALLRLENSLKTTQASFEVQPRVFYEDFHNYVLYVQDIQATAKVASWRKVFLADLSTAGAPKVTTAEQATVLSTGSGVQMRLRNGAEHETSATDPNQYQISTFAESELPIQFQAQDDLRMGHADAPILALSTRDIYTRAKQPGGRWFEIEFQKRLSYPFACLVLMLVGMPLGMSSRRGGKGAGFVLTILLVFVYYFLSSTGVALARQDKIAPWIGVWAANALFAIAGVLLLRGMTRGALTIGPLANLFRRRKVAEAQEQQAEDAVESAVRGRRHRFPLILDEYVLKSFAVNFVLVMFTFVMLLLIFTFFELLGDIIRNGAPLVTVGDYLLNLMPSMIYVSAPLGVLIAVLGTFGVLNRTSELTAMKTSGISLYRVVAPVMVIAALLALTLFVFDDLYLPATNRRQEALRMSIKGKPAQTFLRPDRKWIFGEQRPGEPGRIYYYRFFDTDRNQFADLTVFEFDPQTFLLTRRIFASTVTWQPALRRWVFENGWQRTFNGDEVKEFQQFEVSTFPELREQPEYFKKEVRLAAEMNIPELEHYIRDLQQSGFDVVRLQIALFHKFAYPLIALVMAVLAVPFALSMGRRGSLAGIAVAIGIAIVYWVVANLFEAMGNASMLPPALAAWSPDILFALAGGYLLLRAPT